MKYLTLAAVAAAMLLASDEAMARGRRGGCPGGHCGVVYSAPIQKAEVPVQKEVAKGEASPSDQAQAQVVTSQPTRRIVFSRWRRGR